MPAIDGRRSRTMLFWKTVSAAAMAALMVAGAELPAAMQPKVQAKVKEIQAWAADPAVVAAVKAYNTAPPAMAKAMTPEKWKGLSVLDPSVRAYAKNAAAEAMKVRKDASVSEAFLSGADGGKVAFLSKPSNFSHKGKDKHSVPMSGRQWIGPVEVDDSSGLEQVQVAVPVLDGGRPAGSLVVGLALAKLK